MGEFLAGGLQQIACTFAAVARAALFEAGCGF